MPPKPGLLYGAGAAPLLKASITTLAPLTAGMPKLSAACPDRKLTMPSLNVSWACAAAVQKATLANASATARQNRIVNMLRISCGRRAAGRGRRHLRPAARALDR
jgi:hypothetical protein